MNLQIKNNLIKNSSCFFEKNLGQQYSDAKFILKKGDLTFFFLKDRVTIGVIDPLSEDENKKLKKFIKKSKKQPKEKLPQRKINFMDIFFINSNIDIDIIGEDEQKTKCNYFGNNLAEEGIININTYSKIKYKNIYPNIDLVFYFNENLLEYDFIVKPTGNPNDIELSFNGNDSLNLDKQGNTIISFKDLDMKLLKPISYQIINKDKKQVKSNFIINESKLNIEIETYNKSKELIINPILFYSTYLSGNFETLSYNIAVDSSGSTYVTGYTNSSDFYTTNPIIGVAYNTSYAVFVTKYDTNGNLIYSTYINGNNDDISVSIAVDLSNNVYITGYTYSIDYPILPNVPNTPNIHGFPPDGFNSGIFITKLNELGNTILYSAYIHGESLDYASSIAIDSNNSPYITGFTYSKDYPSTNDLGSKPIIGGTAVFVTKLKPNGYDIDYSTCIYSATNDLPPNPDFAYSYGYAIEVDSIGSACIVGSTYSANYPIVPSANYHGSVIAKDGDTEVFVTKLDSPGQNIIYSSYINDTNDDYEFGISLDRFIIK